jgi:hypothetical protein
LFGSTLAIVIIGSAASTPHTSILTVLPLGQSAFTSLYTGTTLDTLLIGVSNPQITLRSTAPPGSPGTIHTIGGSTLNTVIAVQSDSNLRTTLSTIAPIGSPGHTTTLQGSNGIDTVLAAPSDHNPLVTLSTTLASSQPVFTSTIQGIPFDTVVLAYSKAPQTTISTLAPPLNLGLLRPSKGPTYATVIAAASDSNPTSTLTTTAGRPYTSTFQGASIDTLVIAQGGAAGGKMGTVTTSTGLAPIGSPAYSTTTFVGDTVIDYVFQSDNNPTQTIMTVASPLQPAYSSTFQGSLVGIDTVVIANSDAYVSPRYNLRAWESSKSFESKYHSSPVSVGNS